MKKSRLIAIMVMTLFAVTANAQYNSSDKIRPKWTYRLPKPSNSSFVYKSVTSVASSLEGARQKCLSELISASGLRTGAVVVSDYQSKESVSQIWNNGRLNETINNDFTTTTAAKSKETLLYVDTITEYWTRDKSGEYNLTVLYAKSELGEPPLFDDVEVTATYGMKGFWRSLIIPGWGQFYKGSKWKGGIILGGTALLGVGCVFAESQRVGYLNLAQSTHNTDAKRTYASLSTNWAIGRNICIGAVSALYVYNLVDALVAPGAKRIVTHSKGRYNYAIMPTVMPDGSAGLYAAITF